MPAKGCGLTKRHVNGGILDRINLGLEEIFKEMEHFLTPKKADIIDLIFYHLCVYVYTYLDRS